ncbi:MAG: hypothetical protein K2N56_05655, partial [Oscillospiraceae bacterium]|nr:hypothetical protein [Oscillospiraceae bacterium]
MKHLSLFKIFIALLICSIYLFTCTVMGTVGDDSVSEPAPPPDDSGAQGEGTVDFLPTDDDPAQQPGGLPENLFTLSFKAPPLAQRPFSSGYDPSDRIKDIPSGEDTPPSSTSLLYTT